MAVPVARASMRTPLPPPPSPAPSQAVVEQARQFKKRTVSLQKLMWLENAERSLLALVDAGHIAAFRAHIIKSSENADAALSKLELLNDVRRLNRYPSESRGEMLASLAAKYLSLKMVKAEEGDGEAGRESVTNAGSVSDPFLVSCLCPTTSKPRRMPA